MHGTQHKLLIVDDDHAVRRSMMGYLEDSGFSVSSAVDTHSALDILDQFTPDLVTTDLKMPGENGLALLEKLHEKTPDIPVIIISGAGMMEDVVSALRLGAVDYLIKPLVDMEELVKAINKALRNTQLRQENALYREKLEQANLLLKRHVAALEQDQKAGNFVQQSLLPPTPFASEHIFCEHRVIPALYLSGDCIDYVFLEKRYFAFYLADVSGHGSAPAFVTIWLKNLLVQLVRLRHLLTDLEHVKEAINQLLMVTNDQLIATHINNNLTMIAGIIDTETNELFYSVAGHLPLPLSIHNGKAEYLPGKGPLIGLHEDASWQVHRYQLPESGKLVFFSDGVLEVMPGKGLLEKEEALRQKVEQSGGRLGQMCDALGLPCEQSMTSREISRDSNKLPDDIAVLSLSHSPKTLAGD